MAVDRRPASGRPDPSPAWQIAGQREHLLDLTARVRHDTHRHADGRPARRAPRASRGSASATGVPCGCGRVPRRRASTRSSSDADRLRRRRRCTRPSRSRSPSTRLRRHRGVVRTAVSVDRLGRRRTARAAGRARSDRAGRGPRRRRTGSRRSRTVECHHGARRIDAAGVEGGDHVGRVEAVDVADEHLVVDALGVVLVEAHRHELVDEQRPRRCRALTGRRRSVRRCRRHNRGSPR